VVPGFLSGNTPSDPVPEQPLLATINVDDAVAPADYFSDEMSHETNAIGFPDGYGPLPLDLEVDVAPVRIALVVRSAPVSGTPLLLLRETIDASVYLGCLIDASGDPKTWLEIWVQNVDQMVQGFRAQVEALSNSVIDTRWAARLDTFRRLDRSSVIETGWETVHPLPAFIDTKVGKLVQPVEPTTGRRFVLCTNDAVLTSAGLLAYASSLHRYLWNGPDIETPAFVAVTSQAPAPLGVKTASGAFPELLPFNPAGGFLLVRSFCPLKLADFADVLAGRSWTGFSCCGASFNLGGAYSELGDTDRIVQQGAHLFAGRDGGAGQLREVFHLKMNLIQQVLVQIREAIRSQRSPLLSLSADSFRVGLSQTGVGLPFFWTARVELVESSAGVLLPIPTSDLRYFLPPVTSGPSVYRPQTLSALADGEGELRIRKVLDPGPEGICVEATLVSDERLAIAGSDLIHIRLGLPVGRVDLYGYADESAALAKGETRIRTLPQKLPDSVMTALGQATGTPIRTAHFEILPVLASPCDMYAAGVVAARILLVDEENTLSVAVDELSSLAQQLATEYDQERSFAARLRAIVEADPRWVLALGPHRLTANAGMREMAPRIVPTDLWWDTIGVILRLFPGTGPDSFCRDFGDAPPLALDAIFGTPLAELELLQVRSRSLVVTDWDQNIEIREAIAKVVAKQAVEESNSSAQTLVIDGSN
jgi:hypothetical protein